MGLAAHLAVALRSFTPLTGALCGAIAAASYVGSATAAEIIRGEPHPNILPGAVAGFMFLGVGLSATGALAGLVTARTARARALASPRRKWVAAYLIAAMTVPSWLGIRAFQRVEERSRPRVILTSPSIVKSAGWGDTSRRVSGRLVFDRLRPAEQEALVWQGSPLDVAVGERVLTLQRAGQVFATIDLQDLDYVRQVLAATATLDGQREWLALLVRLRSLSHRDLLVIYDPEGALVHHEMLEGAAGHDPRALLTEGERGTRQTFGVDVGAPLRFAAR